MSKLAKALTAAAGNAGESLYVEDVFSTYLYEGTGSGIAINNGIDLSGEGGLVIYRRRDGAENWSYQDTNRGVDSVLYSDSVTAAANPGGYGLASFNSNGFTTELNTNGADYASWTFRKAKKFFDIVTYTGNSTSGRTVSHNLGSVPACIIIKRIDGTSEWPVYHKDESSYGSTGEYEGRLNESSIFGWDYISGTPTDAVFAVTGDTAVNLNGATYVAYLFASDAGGFGDAGSENIIKCGSYIEPNNGSFTDVNLGFEPQFIIAKCSSSGGSNWVISDSMRGMPVGDGAAILNPNTNAAETAGFANAYFRPTATGFSAGNTFVGGGGETVIYIAIRRPMKTPESGTEVFAPITYTGSGSARTLAFNNPIDTAIIDWRSGSNQEGANFVAHRLLGKYFAINDTAAAVTNDKFKLDNSNGVYYPATTYNTTGNNYVTWGLTRAKEFYDVIIGGGNSVTSEVLNHNLGVTPELVLIAGTELYGNKSTSINLTQWVGWGGDYNYGAQSGFISAWNSTQITTQQYISNTTLPYSIMLFATLAGVSKVGSFSGNGSSKTIDCGFSNGARFVMIKRTDAGSNQGVTTSNWYIWDSARGLSAGNDPYLTNSLSSNFTENNTTDSIDPHSSGFIVNQNTTTDVNKSGASYIFLAIA